MAEVFISYARKDSGFVLDLTLVLQKSQRDAWIDWRSIPASAYWRAEIFAAIEEADNFLFIISPESLRSWMCGQEIGVAVANKKRIVTILYQAVDHKDLPPALAEIQWIGYPELGFEATFQKLVAAIDTDLRWVRQHTRLGGKARDWERNDRDSSYLLRGVDLREAIKWLAEAPSVREPKPSPLHEQYIHASQQWEAREMDRPEQRLRGLTDQEGERLRQRLRGMRKL